MRQISERFYQRQLLPRIIDKACATKEIRQLRPQVMRGLAGDVIEVGFGSGLSLLHYPASVRKVLAVEPSLVARKLATDRLAASPIPVEWAGLDGQRLTLDDGSVDRALSTFTLCTIPDVSRALAELHRVMRSGGRIHFLEHGLAPDPRVATWQHRLTPLQRRCFGGCHLDRPIDRLLADNGFEVGELRNCYLKGPKASGYIYAGTAQKC
ncbi:MAG: class I SAM-dependent methyltransferase [Acidimicrobiales bacterium]